VPKTDIGYDLAVTTGLLAWPHLSCQHDQHIDIGRLGVEVAPRVPAVEIHPAQPLAIAVGQRGFELAQGRRHLGRQLTLALAARIAQ